MTFVTTKTTCTPNPTTLFISKFSIAEKFNASGQLLTYGH